MTGGMIRAALLAALVPTPELAEVPPQSGPVADVAPAPDAVPPTLPAAAPRRPVRDWLAARKAALGEQPVRRWVRGLVGNEYAEDPNVRMDRLLHQSDDPPSIGERLRRFWFHDAPPHLTPERIHGGIFVVGGLSAAEAPSAWRAVRYWLADRTVVRKVHAWLRGEPYPASFGGLTLPSGQYLKHYPQYFPPDPQFPLQREVEMAPLPSESRRELAPMPREVTFAGLVLPSSACKPYRGLYVAPDPRFPLQREQDAMQDPGVLGRVSPPDRIPPARD